MKGLKLSLFKLIVDASPGKKKRRHLDQDQPSLGDIIHAAACFHALARPHYCIWGRMEYL